MLGAPFWSVVTINAGFIGMAAEACSGRVSPFWIIAPLAYFAGYSVAVVLNHQAVDAAVREMAQRQARADLPFPAAGAALVVDAPSAGPLIGMTQSLVRDYSIPVVYERAGRATPFSHIAYRLGAAQTCLTIRQTPSYLALGYSADLRGDLCVYAAPEDPELPRYDLTLGAAPPSGAWSAHLLTPVRISDPSGRSVELLRGEAERLPWFPQPVLGCVLDSGAPAWRCDAGFMRETRPLEDRRPEQLVAGALGLHESSATERAEAIKARPGPDFDAISSQLLADSLAKLDSFLAGQTVSIAYRDVEVLRPRPDLLAPRADAMAEALRRTLDTASGHPAFTEGLGIVQELLAALGAKDFARVGGKVLDAFVAVPNLRLQMIADNLTFRLGDLGPVALPALQRIFAVQAAYRPGGIVGLCRLGAPAAGSADRVAAIMNEKKKVRRQFGEEAIYWAAYLALDRFGRRDLLDPDIDAGRYAEEERNHFVILPRWDAAALSPDDCMVGQGWPRWPDDGASLAQPGK